MRDLNIRYKIGTIYNEDSFVVSKKNHAILCTCPNEHEIYIWGDSIDFEEWWNVIIHENFHAVLWANDVDPNSHHPIMFMISELIEKSDKNE